MLLTLLLYGYCRGVYSSRKIAAGCEIDVAFRYLSGGQFPDFRTVSDFRKNHLEAFQCLFIEALRLCREAGMVRLGHLSLDGSKYQANASRHKAMSYGRMGAAADQLEAEVQELLDRAAAVDEAEDAEYGAAVRGDELPEELRRREERLTRIKEAKARLEERARSRARDEARGRGRLRKWRPPLPSRPSLSLENRATSPTRTAGSDRRMMKSPQGWVQGYNAQIMVEESSGVIVAQEVSNQGVDTRRLGPMLGILEQNLTRLGVPETERCPRLFTAGAGYCSEGSLRLLADRGIDAYVATGRERHHRAGIGGGVPAGTPRRSAMRDKLRTPEGRGVYARRKTITEPVFGCIKQARGFRQFLLRGGAGVSGEFTLIALTHNLLKLWRAGMAATG
jgi:hypothetical protein